MTARINRSRILASMTANIDKQRRHGFHPALAQTLAMMALLPVLVTLGVWQFHRALEKERLFAAEAAAEQAVPLPVTSLPATNLPLHVSATGRYGEQVFLLDNRVRAGRAGYELLAPLRLADGRAVLVDRGWLSQGASRADLPAVAASRGVVTVTGLALIPMPLPFSLSDREVFAPGWPKVVQTAVPQRLATVLGYPLLPIVLYPDGSAVAADELAAMHAFGPERHRAYALQWFVMAAVLIAVYLYHGLHRGKQS